MKTYAIKTEKGYLARQGNYNWFEDKPVGWALFCKEDDAKKWIKKNFDPTSLIIKTELA